MEYTIDESVQFYGVIKSVRHFLSLIKAINIKSVVSCSIMKEGFVLTVEDQRSVKATGYFKIHQFHIFNLKDNTQLPTFALPIDTLTHCFRTMLPRTDYTNQNPASSDYCEISYDGTGSYLVLKRVMKDQTMTCELIPFEPEEESSQLQFEESTEMNSVIVIMKPVWFKDLMNDLDSRYDKIKITISPNGTPFSVVAEGADLLSESDYPQDSEPFISFTCDQELTFNYHYSHIVQCKKALDISSEVCIQMYVNGALRIFFQIEGSNSNSDAIQFNFLPSTSFS